MGLFNFMKSAPTNEEYKNTPEYRMGYQYAKMRQYAPEVADLWLEQMQQRQIQQYMAPHLGTAGTPEKVAPYALDEDEYYGAQDLWSMQDSGYKTVTPATRGTGYLGGQMSKEQLASTLAMAPNQKFREKGVDMMIENMSPPYGKMNEWDMIMNHPEAHRLAMEQRGLSQKGTEINVLPQQVRSVEEQAKLDQLSEYHTRKRSNVTDFMTGYRTGMKTRDGVKRSLELLRQGASTGFGEKSLKNIKAFLERFGVKFEGLPSQEELEVHFGDFVMARIQETKGAVSNAEMKLFASYSPEMTKTVGGNYAILKWHEKILDRAATIAKEVKKMERMRSPDGTMKYSSADISDFIDDYIEKNPVWLDTSGHGARPEAGAPVSSKRPAPPAGFR